MNPNDLRYPNVFLAEESRTSVQMEKTISVRCPHCRQLGSFHAPLKNGLQYTKRILNNAITHFQAVIRLCPNIQCNGLIFVVEQNGEAIKIEPPQLLDFNPENLPTQCQITLKEAIACHAAGAYRASAMMVRRLLEEICDLNSAKGRDLHQRLDALKSLISLPQPLFEAMNVLKALGNDAAHIEAKAYDNIGREESEDSLELAKEILKSLYQLQGLVTRLQSRKSISAS